MSLRKKIFGNFKKSRIDPVLKPHQNSEPYKARPGMSDDHCGLIRKMPCCICLRTPGGEIHHLKSVPGRGMGIRSENKWGVPLCRTDHELVERAGSKNEIKLFKDVGIDCHLLANDLWKATGCLPKMIKILMAHRSHK
jgi:hypothetical protein